MKILFIEYYAFIVNKIPLEEQTFEKIYFEIVQAILLKCILFLLLDVLLD